MKHFRAWLVLLVCGAMVALVPAIPVAQTLAPAFAAGYSLLNLGSATGVPVRYGGVFILASQPNTLYIGGLANEAGGALYAVPLARDSGGFITGFAGPGVRVANAPFNDGGMGRDPGGLISYAQWPSNNYAQVNLATGTVVNTIPLGPLGVASASSSVAFIPAGFPGAGGMRIASWSGGQFYQAAFTVGAGGIIAINSVTPVPASQLPGGPEGWAYVLPGSPQITVPSMIVSEYSANQVAVYDMDGSGNPVVASRRLFISGLTGAEGAFIDPVTGSFIFSTFGGINQVIVVRGFAPPPVVPPVVPPTTAPQDIPTLSEWALIALTLFAGLIGMRAIRRRR